DRFSSCGDFGRALAAGLGHPSAISSPVALERAASGSSPSSEPTASLAETNAAGNELASDATELSERQTSTAHESGSLAPLPAGRRPLVSLKPFVGAGVIGMLAVIALVLTQTMREA